MRLKGRYIPDSRIFKEEPAGIYEDPIGEGVAELRVEPLSVITITPRPVRSKRGGSRIRKGVIFASAIVPPVLFVAMADLLIFSPAVFFGTFAAAFGWPAFVYWANVRD